jgi:hypothetical protein
MVRRLSRSVVVVVVRLWLFIPCGEDMEIEYSCLLYHMEPNISKNFVISKKIRQHVMIELTSAA